MLITQSESPQVSVQSPDALRAAEEERFRGWMTAAQAGDVDSYERLLAELSGVLRGFLRRLLVDHELVEDCLQECLLAIHKSRHTYDPRRPFKPWMFTLARYKTIDVVRKGRTRGRYEEPERDAPSPDPGAPEPGATLDMAQALEALDAPYRDAVLWTKLQGYTLAEAAGRAGVSKAAMRSRVYRGLRQLRRVLERELQ